MKVIANVRRRSRRATSLGAVLPEFSLKARWLILAGFALVSATIVWFGEDASANAQTPAKKAAAKKAANKKDSGKAVTSQPIPGLGQQFDATAISKLIDAEIQGQLDLQKVKPSARSDDAEFLRRVYLDLIGVIPPREKVVAFLNSTDANKRAQVVEELLAHPRFGTFFAEVWSEVMVPCDSANRLLLSEPLVDWLAKQFSQNRPWDKVVYDLVTSTGTAEQNGAVTYFVANTTVDKMTDSVTKLFMGVQLQCAQCHNHPFTKWKQDEYWGMAQFFINVRVSNAKMVAKKGATEVVEANTSEKKGQELPESAKNVPAKFLEGEKAVLPAGPAYRPALAKWLTAKDNPFFARAFVNKTWYHFFGRGLVNPVDDMHENNPASHPVLLEALTEQAKANGFDVKQLIRAIVLSETYQRTSRPLPGNAEHGEIYCQAAVRNLSPYQLFDSLSAVVGPPTKADKAKADKKAAKKAGAREQFINFFHVEDADPLEYQAGIPQALRLMNSPMTNKGANPLLNEAMQAGKPAQVIDHLYLAVLLRRPTAEESQRHVAYVSRPGTNPRDNFGNILWALVNSAEFSHNH